MTDIADFSYARRFKGSDDANKKFELRDRELEEYINTKLKPRAVSLATSTTRPTSNLYSGLEIYETDTKRVLRYEGTTWVPVAYLGAWDTTGRVNTALVSQGASTPTFSVTVDEWKMDGSEITWNFHYVFSSAGSAANPIYVRLPFDIVGGTSATRAWGNVLYYVASGAGTRYNILPEFGASASSVSFGADGGSGNLFGVNPAVTVAASDQIRGWIKWRWR